MSDFAQPREPAQQPATLCPAHPYRGVVGHGRIGMSAQPAQPAQTTGLCSCANHRTDNEHWDYNMGKDRASIRHFSLHLRTIRNHKRLRASVGSSSAPVAGGYGAANAEGCRSMRHLTARGTNQGLSDATGNRQSRALRAVSAGLIWVHPLNHIAGAGMKSPIDNSKQTLSM
jgi:hypothetical protein